MSISVTVWRMDCRGEKSKSRQLVRFHNSSKKEIVRVRVMVLVIEVDGFQIYFENRQ